jgi:hypothetical protein
METLSIWNEQLLTLVMVELTEPSVVDSLFVTFTWYNLHEIEVLDGTKCRRKGILGKYLCYVVLSYLYYLNTI